MKWYCCINEAGLLGGEPFQMLLVALRSCLKNTSLMPHLVYCGAEHENLNVLRTAGFTIIHHSPSLESSLRQFYGQKYLQFCGHWLRVDIPEIELDDQYILYTDIDVLFLQDFPSEQFQPDLIACGPEHHRGDYSYFNSGTMVINVPACRKLLPAFRAMVAARIDSGEMLDDDHDQVNLNLFFKDRWDQLPMQYNWKPYWGRSDSARIIHFHGPKPGLAKSIMLGQSLEDIGADWKVIFSRNPAGYRYYLALYDHYLTNPDSAVSEDEQAVPQEDVRNVPELKGDINRAFKGKSRVALFYPEQSLILIARSEGNWVLLIDGGHTTSLPISGDWNGDGEVGTGLYLPDVGRFLLHENLFDLEKSYAFHFGPDDRGWLPLAGDWDGDGRDSVGLYNPSDGSFFLINRHFGGDADCAFRFGPENAGLKPVAGDWTGSGSTSVGLYDPALGHFLLRPNPSSMDINVIEVDFCPESGVSLSPLAGDWTGEGRDSVGLYDRQSGTFYLRLWTGEVRVDKPSLGALGSNGIPFSMAFNQSAVSRYNEESGSS